MIRKGNVGKISRIMSGFNRDLDVLLLWPALPWVSEMRERTAPFSVCFSVTVINLLGREENLLHL